MSERVIPCPTCGTEWDGEWPFVSPDSVRSLADELEAAVDADVPMRDRRDRERIRRHIKDLRALLGPAAFPRFPSEYPRRQPKENTMNLTTDFRPGQIALIRTRRDGFAPPTASHLAMREAQGWKVAWSKPYGDSYNGGSMTIFDYDTEVRVTDVVPLTVDVDVDQLGKVGLSSTSLDGLGPSVKLRDLAELACPHA